MGNYLQQPDRSKQGQKDGRSERLSFGSCAMQGWRQQMEDAHLSILGFNGKDEALFAVFDGHGGREVALFSKQNFPKVFSNSEHYLTGDIPRAMTQGYLELDELLSNPSSSPEAIDGTSRAARTRWESVGCTAVSVFIQNEKIHVANCGDSRAVLCKRGVAVPLTVDHKPGLPAEKSRILAAGGVVLHGRVNGNLNLSRAIGDFAFKASSLAPEAQMITAVPEISQHVITDDDEFLVIACDGVWELWDSQAVCDFVKQRLRRTEPLSHLVGELLDSACSGSLRQASGLGLDNLTCIIVDLRPGKELLPDAEDKPQARVRTQVPEETDSDDEFDA